MKTVYPVEGRLVRDPHTGREVTEPLEISESDSFWIRRIADGDVSETATQVVVPADNTPGGEQ